MGPVFDFSADLRLPALEWLRLPVSAAALLSRLICIVADQDLHLIGITDITIPATVKTRLSVRKAMAGLCGLQSGTICFQARSEEECVSLSQWLSRIRWAESSQVGYKIVTNAT